MEKEVEISQDRLQKIENRLKNEETVKPFEMPKIYENKMEQKISKQIAITKLSRNG